MSKKSNQRKSDAARKANRVIRNRTLLLMGLMGVVAFVVLFGRLYYLQIIRHEKLQEEAVGQQTRKTVVSASRGTIYDKNGNIVAISATAETVHISPLELKEFMEKQDEDIENEKLLPAQKRDNEYIARGLSRILGVSEESILKKMERTFSKYERIKLQADQEEADEVRRFINGEIDDQGNPVLPDEDGNYRKLRGVYLVTDPKRYYPYDTLASQIIGFVNAEDDNKGAYGLEAVYEDELTGTSGLVVTAKNAKGTDMLYQYEQYYDAQNGNNLVLTIDTTIQYYLEKGMGEMLEKFAAKNGAAGIIMDVNTGGILAMASLPNYNLNEPRAVYDESLKKTMEGLEGDAYSEALGAAQLKQWRNKAVNDTYEPGSTFKILTLAAALDEGTVNLNSSFSCSGSIHVPGWSKAINCSRRAPGHGLQNLTQATGNSCNPAFITMGLKLGTSTYYSYLKAFGLMEKTGIDINGEVSGLFADEKSFGKNVVSLASYAFGQTFNVTPLALITAQAACINGGYLRTPYLVRQITDSEGNVLSEHDDTPVRQVISEDTSATVRGCLEYVVASGTGKNGQVAGYRLGGKTGTADKTGTRTAANPKGDVVVSFVCFAPADDPQVMMLITLDTPSRNTPTYVSGGNMVAPSASKIMSEVLPYLGVEPDYSAEALEMADATVPNVVGSTEEEAKSKLEKSGFGYKTIGSGDKVTDQTPVGGAIAPGNATILLYLGEKKPDALCAVPDVVGKTAEQANTALTNAGLIMRVTGAISSTSGNVHAISQSIAPATQVTAGTVVTVQLGDGSVRD